MMQPAFPQLSSNIYVRTESCKQMFKFRFYFLLTDSVGLMTQPLCGFSHSPTASATLLPSGIDSLCGTDFLALPLSLLH